MTEADLRALGATRRAVFQNLANGLPEARLMEDLRLSQLELDQARRAVARKIGDWLMYAKQAPIACASVREILWNRRPLLAVLARIGDLSLGSDFITFADRKTGRLVKVQFGRITTQALDHPEMIEGAKHRMAEAHLARRD